jgi:glutaminyl-tRNA synthetase
MNKFNSTVEINVLENYLRDDLNKRAERRMAVLRPLKVVITNYPEGQSEELDAINNPEDPSAGTRKVPFSRTIYIEQDDFRETPPPKYFRLAPGVEVRLRYAYFIKATDVIKDAAGNVVEVHATYDPATRGGDSPDGRKVKGTIHWVSAEHAIPAEVRLYDHLFKTADPEDVPEGQDWRVNLNPNSLAVIKDARLEPALAAGVAGARYQFERLGYFTVDKDATSDRPVFNRTVTLKDTWAKEEKKQQPAAAKAGAGAGSGRAGKK